MNLGPGSPEFLRANAKVKELDRDCYCVFSQLRPAGERCRVHFDQTVDIGDGVERKTTALVASGRTWVEALEMFWHWAQDPNRKAVFFDKVLRG